MCASHILVRARITEADRQRVDDSLQDLRRRSLSGEDFAQLARDHSQDPGTASQGGLWRILDSEAIEPFLVPYVTGLGLGDISQPFFIEDGGHIVKINDDYATLESLVREEQVAVRMEQLIKDYRQEIHVEERLEKSWLWDPLETADSSASEPTPDAVQP
jgi:peptidyl-prolyl cis-trans isomerase SurA